VIGTAMFFQKGSAYYQQSLLLYFIAPLTVYNQEFQSQLVFHLYFQRPSFASSPWLPQIFLPFCWMNILWLCFLLFTWAPISSTFYIVSSI